MANQAKKFYVTTPIYYATARPHLGTLYSTVLADVAARWNKVKGNDVFFLTGTDEYGQKIAQAADDAGKDPKSFVDQFIPAYKDIWKKYQIEYDGFIRTTDKNHVEAVQVWLKKLIDKGDIYKGAYKGWYCTPCETYLTEKDYEKDTQNPVCPSCERETKEVSEECYFFKLSKYQDKLLAFYEQNPNFITPKERMAEVVSFVKGGLQDLSISRTTIDWGVPFPGDGKHVTYVWADALNNYITGVGYAQAGREEEFKKWWPADMQVIGKDIVRFHAIYWPAFLMASELPLPKQLLVHGWIKMGQYKMSKSRGNSIDPQNLLDTYGSDCVRYYLMRQIAITQDGQFTIQDLEQKITTDLANDLGNLLNRTTMLALKNKVQKVTPCEWQEEEKNLHLSLTTMIEDFTSYMDKGYYHMALAQVWKYLNLVNAYFHSQEPWKLAKKDPEAFMRVLSASCHSLHAVALLLWPVMPEKMEALHAALGFTGSYGGDSLSQLQNPWSATFNLTQTETPLFVRPEPTEKQEEQTVNENGYITIDDVVKVELHVGTIIACENVEAADKLLRLKVDLGELGERQIFAGVKKYYTPEELLNKQGVFVTNLKPRKMLGEESQGMMLFVKDAEKNLKFVTVSANVPNGSRLV